MLESFFAIFLILSSLHYTIVAWNHLVSMCLAMNFLTRLWEDRRSRIWLVCGSLIKKDGIRPNQVRINSSNTVMQLRRTDIMINFKIFLYLTRDLMTSAAKFISTLLLHFFLLPFNIILHSSLYWPGGDIPPDGVFNDSRLYLFLRPALQLLSHYSHLLYYL